MDGIDRVGKSGTGGLRRTSGKRPAGVFGVPSEGGAAEAETTSGTLAPAGLTALGCLLGAQEAGLEAVQEREARQRGRDMLRGLSDLQRGLLAGCVDPSGMRRLADLAADPPAVEDARLAAVLRSIRLRVQVELARHGL